MLFPYTYVPHKMEKMQEFIDFIFYEVWSKAPGSGPFSLDLFAANVELLELMHAFYYSDAQGADFFCSNVECIYLMFADLSLEQIDQIIQWYRGNNDVERICANDPAAHIARYCDVASISPDLEKRLALFFKGLYSQSLLGLSILKDKIGDIDDHYNAFVRVNDAGKCPFCGMADIRGEYNSTREAYDHYLPKSLYPFNSVNFHNLVPACPVCNSSYKTSKDPAVTQKDPAGEGRRRKVFFPYTTRPYNLEIRLDLNHTDIEHLEPSDIDVNYGPPELSEEIETWRDVYGIDERYKAKCCNKNDGKYWLIAVLDEWTKDGRLPVDYMKTQKRLTVKSPYAECNFLKLAFLEGCQRVGLFDSAG